MTDEICAYGWCGETAATYRFGRGVGGVELFPVCDGHADWETGAKDITEYTDHD